MYIEKPKSDFELVPAGNHVAICYRFIDLGTQSTEWQGKKSHKRKVLISWELPNELMTSGDFAGQPFTIGKRYTWSMHEKAELRKDLESWRNRAFGDDDFEGPNRFNVKNIIGKPCMLSIVHDSKDGSTYSNIKGIASLPKGMTVPAPINPPVYFALVEGLYDPAVFANLSDRIRETITKSPEYDEIVNGKKPNQASQNFARTDLDDEVPF